MPGNGHRRVTPGLRDWTLVNWKWSYTYTRGRGSGSWDLKEYANGLGPERWVLEGYKPEDVKSKGMHGRRTTFDYTNTNPEIDAKVRCIDANYESGTELPAWNIRIYDHLIFMLSSELEEILVLQRVLDSRAIVNRYGGFGLSKNPSLRVSGSG
ncbi:MAG: hypothetical protein M1814_004050 [Vezdaea aestivalis]|nr:MAG: hypothetical protein M1814_004050 [Vezdaea aestivalis]